MKTDELDFHLPQGLIAQTPPPVRSEARLLHYRQSNRSIAHRTFTDLPGLLRPGDLLVFNDSRVIPARFRLQKETGGVVEALFLSQPSQTRWHVLLRNLGSYGSRPLRFMDESALMASVVRLGNAGEHEFEINSSEPATDILAHIGRMPMPPYIKRAKDRDPLDAMDRDRYQTVYSNQAGSVAAPTAGLHFTPAILDQLKSRGVQSTQVTLHVGLGTFKPVVADTLDAHPMHTESYTISQEAAAAINRAKQGGRRIVAVGTTATRVLESQPPGDLSPRSGETNIFIYPPYQWKHVGAMVTNFHLPRSTLVALVAALVGLDEQRRIYREAIERGYRFFSYGDTSLLE